VTDLLVKSRCTAQQSPEFRQPAPFLVLFLPDLLEFNRKICDVTAKMLDRLQAILEVASKDRTNDRNEYSVLLPYTLL
jgi:hypothetical protein